jgi:hypothetical protein
VGDTHIGKRKLKAGLRKDKEKKAKTTDEAVLRSDESTPSPDEGRSPPYQESNLSTSASFDDDDRDGGDYRIEPSQPLIQFTGTKYQQIYLYSFHIIFLISLTHALLISGESHYTNATQNMDHGAPHSQRETIMAQDRHTSRGMGRHIFPRWTIRLLKIQVASCPMSMYSTHTWPPILHNWFKMCNGSMSMRIRSSITCWCNNGKQLSYGRDKRGKSTMPNCWLRRG